MRARFALTIVLGTVAAAHAGNTEVSTGSYNRALRSESANAVTDDTLVGVNLGAARKLQLDLVPRLDVWATAGFVWAAAEGTLFQTMTTEVDTVGLSVGGRASYALHRNLHVSARLDLGTARNALTINGNGHEVSDASWGGTVTTAVGLDMMVVAHPRFSIGFRFDLGYVAASAVALSPREDGDSSKIELDAMQASIGHLDLGGRFLSLSAISQF